MSNLKAELEAMSAEDLEYTRKATKWFIEERLKEAAKLNPGIPVDRMCIVMSKSWLKVIETSSIACDAGRVRVIYRDGIEDSNMRICLDS